MSQKELLKFNKNSLNSSHFNLEAFPFLQEYSKNYICFINQHEAFVSETFPRVERNNYFLTHSSHFEASAQHVNQINSHIWALYFSDTFHSRCHSDPFQTLELHLGCISSLF